MRGGRGARGRKKSPNPPQVAAPPVTTPIITVTPVTVALQRPHRERRAPARVRENETDGEFFNTGDISSDEEDDPASTRVRTQAHPSPLQTATNTARSDPLLTGGLSTQSNKAAVDVHELTIIGDGDRKICKLCK
jgi:hypothetical protein